MEGLELLTYTRKTSDNLHGVLHGVLQSNLSTKIRGVVQTLRSIQNKSPTAKTLVFSYVSVLHFVIPSS